MQGRGNCRVAHIDPSGWFANYCQLGSDPNNRILGAVEVLQFDVAEHRFKGEICVEAVVEPVGVQGARWLVCRDDKEVKRFREKAYENLAEDGDGQLVCLAPTRGNLNLTLERWPDLRFLATPER